MNGEAVTVCEVGLRDGLQNQPNPVSTDDKLALLDALIAAGVRDFEVTSFVSPKRVPQLADASELFARLPAVEGCRYMALVPNLKGYRRAAEAGARAVSVVLAATETLNRRNIGMTLDEAVAACRDVIHHASHDGVEVRAYVAAACGCPYEGAVAGETVIDLADRMLDAGAGEVAIADTIGAGNPGQVADLFDALIQRDGAEVFAGHFHDTRGMGLVLAWAALQAGVKKIDSAIGGLGGCPFAPGASGNLATEDLVFMLNESGYRTGIDMAALDAAIAVAGRATGVPVGGKVMPWYRSRKAAE
ncbi:MAG: hydroxymethylglutaryl-CoA lyase [Rhodospirillaceae bacterium]|nr:hydroxymethylglutaryl-CoA lyase [Rhodospirillaceae bacterium]